MNLFKLHTDPEQLFGYEQKYKLPETAWKKAFLMVMSPSYNREDVIPLEQYIKNGDYESYMYARDVKAERWPPGEPAIINGSPEWAWKYVKNVLREPWPEGEATIFKDGWYKIKYKDMFGIRYDGSDIEFSNR